MILRIQHNKVFLESITDEGHACVRKTLKIHFKDQYAPAGFQTIQLYDWKEKSFPTGYLGRVQRALEKARVDFTQSDQRRYPAPKIKFKGSLGFDFFDHQDKAVEAALLAHTGLISCPTATGKSAIISETIRGRGVRTLVIVPFEGIQLQLAKTLYVLSAVRFFPNPTTFETLVPSYPSASE